MRMPHSGWTSSDDEALKRLHRKIESERKKLGIDFFESAELAEENRFLKEWEKRLPHAAAIVLDVFDSALIRSCLSAEDVFLFLKEVPPFSTWPLMVEPIHAARIAAERASRAAQRQQSGSSHATLEEIYRRLLENTGQPEEDLAACVEGECVVERAFCTANAPVQRLVAQAIQANKRVLFFSDSPHDSPFLESLLRQCGYEVVAGSVFSTGDTRRGTSENFLATACRQWGVQVNELLFLSSAKSEHAESVRRLGIPILEHPYRAKTVSPAREAGAPFRRCDSLVRGLAQIVTPHPLRDHFWQRLGSEIFGPLFAGFTLWLAERWRAEGIESGFFLEPEGNVLQPLYELLRNTRPDLPPSHLLAASHRAYAIPALGCGLEDDPGFLLEEGGRRQIVREFLSRFDLDPDLFASACIEAGFRSLDDTADPHCSRVRLRRLFRHADVLAVLTQRAATERQALQLYLQKQAVVSDPRTAIVHTGRSRLAQYLAAVLREENANTLPRFHTLGAFASPGIEQEGYLCQSGQPLSLAQILRRGQPLLDGALRSLTPTVRYFRKREQLEVITEPATVPPAQADALRALRDGILLYAETLFRHPFAAAVREIPAELAAGEFGRLVLTPSPEEALQLGSWEEGPSGRALATFGHESLEPDKIWESYRAAIWKEGLLGMDTPQAWILRKLIGK